MPKKIEESLHILCPSRAYLAPVNLMGPIVQPLRVGKKAVVQLLMSGAEVYEYIPSTKGTLKLTLKNINDPDRYNSFIPKPDVENPVGVDIKESVKVDISNIDTAPRENPVINAVKDKFGVDLTATDNSEVPTEEVNRVENYKFDLNEDGTVNESTISWSEFSKNERKALRARITEINAIAHK